MFLGEAPGIEESRTGRPFIGRAGKFLTRMLDSIGIKREEVFITSPVKYYPGRRAPNIREIRHGMIHTKKQIETIKPKLIVLLGNVALKALIDEKAKISEFHGKIIRKNGIVFIPTFHPSAAMRFPKIKEKMKKDFGKIKSFIKRRLHGKKN
jgi:DNA polymerase